MDGDLRYAMVREQIRQQHEVALLERRARRVRPTLNARVEPAWTSGIVTVAGSLTRRLGRRPTSA